MTDKQIMIDGVDVSGCDELYVSQANTIVCEITGYLCEDRQNCYYKQHKRQERRCKMWEDIAVDNGELVLKYQQQLDQLKAENDELKKEVNNKYSVSNFNVIFMREHIHNLKQTLAEIKEIARVGAFYWKHYKEESKRYNEILQKISECEVE